MNQCIFLLLAWYQMSSLLYWAMWVAFPVAVLGSITHVWVPWGIRSSLGNFVNFGSCLHGRLFLMLCGVDESMIDCQTSGDDWRANVFDVYFQWFPYNVKSCFVDLFQQERERVVFAFDTERSGKFHCHFPVVGAGLVSFLDTINQNSGDGDPGCAFFTLFVVVASLFFSGLFLSVLCHEGRFFNSEKGDFLFFFVLPTVSSCNRRDHPRGRLQKAWQSCWCCQSLVMSDYCLTIVMGPSYCEDFTVVF